MGAHTERCSPAGPAAPGGSAQQHWPCHSAGQREGSSRSCPEEIPGAGEKLSPSTSLLSTALAGRPPVC